MTINQCLNNLITDSVIKQHTSYNVIHFVGICVQHCFFQINYTTDQVSKIVIGDITIKLIIIEITYENDK